MQPVLNFDRVSKQFHSRRSGLKLALDALTMEVETGEIVGFLGPNGAGKTTALRLALGFLKPSSGRGEVFGAPFGDAAARRQAGFVSDQPVFFPGSAQRAVAMAAIFSGTRASDEAVRASLDVVGLSSARGDVRKFSRGMQQRLALAQALVHQPRLLILDEPISALDPLSTVEVLALLKRLRDAGTAILLSSHQLEAVATVADRVVLLDQGREVLSGRTAQLLRGGGEYELTFKGLPDGVVAGRHAVVRGDRHLVRCKAAEQRAVIEAAWALGAELIEVRQRTETLTELFLRTTVPGNGSAGERAQP